MRHNVVAGFGFRQKAGRESLLDCYTRALGAFSADVLSGGFSGKLLGARTGARIGALGEAGYEVVLLASAQDKVKSAALQALAEHLGVAALGILDAALAQERVRTQSKAVFAARGVGSVAEAAALAGAGAGARLLGARVTSHDRMAVCALALKKDAGI